MMKVVPMQDGEGDGGVRKRSTRPTGSPLGDDEWAAEERTPVEAFVLRRLIQEAVRDELQARARLTVAWMVAIVALLILAGVLIGIVL